MKKLLAVVCVFSFILLSSCELLLALLLEGESDQWYEGNPSSGNFWAVNFKNNKHYRVDAVLAYEGTNCKVYAEKSANVSNVQAKAMADEYDKNIFPKMVNAFSMKNFSIEDGSESYNFTDIMKFASWFVDGDGKLCILLLDIKDDYKKGVNNSYVAGYFWGGDFTNRNGSNGRDMIYIDVNPGLDPDNIKDTYKTLAHEMQHLMNFATSLVLMVEEKRSELMDTWVDEGLASAAEWVYSGEYEKARINWFKNNGNYYENGNKAMTGLIDKGNTFFVWDNRGKENQYAVLDDYATVNIFFQWLRLQSNDSIYRDIITSEYYDYQAVTSAFAIHVPTINTWDKLLSSWFAANHINAPSGLYGYRDETDLKDIKVPAPASLTLTLSLAPGEGVYSKTSINPNFNGIGNIKYAYLSSSTMSSYHSANSTLLTYNANIKTDGSSENGSTTGVPIAASSVDTVSIDRSAVYAPERPYRIDAGEMLRNKPVDMEQLKGFRRISRVEHE